MPIDLKKIRGWEDATQAGIDLKLDLDRTHLILGALVNYVLPHRQAGRPAKAEEKVGAKRTLTAFAKAIGVDRAWLSKAAGNAEFWHDNFELIPPQATILQLTRARKTTGWKPGRKVFAKHRKQALEILLKDIEGAPPKRVPPTAKMFVGRADEQLDRALVEENKKLDETDRELVHQAKEHLSVVLGEQG